MTDGEALGSPERTEGVIIWRTIEADSQSYKNPEKTENQDRSLCPVYGSEEAWGVVIDGVSLSENPAAAAQEAKNSISISINNGGNDLPTIIHNAQEAIRSNGGGGKAVLAMARITTEDGPKVEAVSIGDSRVAIVGNGQFNRITADDAGVTGQPTQALGVVDRDLAINIREEPIYSGDWVLVYTDGLTNNLPENKILEIIAEGERAGLAIYQIVEQITKEAADGPVKDDVTAVLLRYTEIQEENVTPDDKIGVDINLETDKGTSQWTIMGYDDDGNVKLRGGGQTRSIPVESFYKAFMPETYRRVRNARSVDDLLGVVRNIGVVKGSRQNYTPNEIENLIEVAKSSNNFDLLPKAYGIRKAVQNIHKKAQKTNN